LILNDFNLRTGSNNVFSYGDYVMCNDKRFNKDDFVSKACIVHGDTYDYSHTVYVNNAMPLRIDCRVPGHGPFWQSPGNHCRGNGCPACSESRRISKAIAAAAKRFVAKAKSVHGEFYDYAKAVYTGGKSEVTIRCPRHGSFQQIAALHLTGSGCPTCEMEEEDTVRSKTLERFKARSIARHGTVYDYSEVEYVTLLTKVKIVCPVHGTFYQRPAQHLAGEGCPKCGMQRSAAARKDSLESFVAKAIACHGDVYDYSEVEYVNSHTKVKISCPTDGPFFKTPAAHIFGEGCPACVMERRRRMPETQASNGKPHCCVHE
jgi:hypothetical protein